MTDGGQRGHCKHRSAARHRAAWRLVGGGPDVHRQIKLLIICVGRGDLGRLFSRKKSLLRYIRLASAFGARDFPISTRSTFADILPASAHVPTLISMRYVSFNAVISEVRR